MRKKEGGIGETAEENRMKERVWGPSTTFCPPFSASWLFTAVQKPSQQRLQHLPTVILSVTNAFLMDWIKSSSAADTNVSLHFFPMPINIVKSPIIMVIIISSFYISYSFYFNLQLNSMWYRQTFLLLLQKL